MPQYWSYTIHSFTGEHTLTYDSIIYDTYSKYSWYEPVFTVTGLDVSNLKWLVTAVMCTIIMVNMNVE